MAQLNTLAGVERFASPGEWLAEIRRAAEALYVAPNVEVSELLFTDPGSWSAGDCCEVERKLDAAERNWPNRRRPCAYLCWIAHDVSEYEINAENPSEGHVRVTSPVAFPSVYSCGISGPYLFLGVVAWPDDGGRWECRQAHAQPIVDQECPIPVDSGYERTALNSLPHLVSDLRDDVGLLEALGGTVRVELQKPLFDFDVAGSRCRPDALVTVTRPGGYGHRPREPGRRPSDGPYEDRDTVRYVIEVMGFGDPEYERDKEEMHSRMRWIGHVCRMEAGQFESSYNGVDRQRERITRQIRKDIVWRWKTVTGGETTVPSIELKVNFAFDSAQLDYESPLTLDALGRVLSSEDGSGACNDRSAAPDQLLHVVTGAPRSDAGDRCATTCRGSVHERWSGRDRRRTFDAHGNRLQCWHKASRVQRNR